MEPERMAPGEILNIHRPITIATGMVIDKVKVPHGFWNIALTTTMAKPAMAITIMNRIAKEVVTPVTGPTSRRAMIARPCPL